MAGVDVLQHCLHVSGNFFLSRGPLEAPTVVFPFFPFLAHYLGNAMNSTIRCPHRVQVAPQWAPRHWTLAVAVHPVVGERGEGEREGGDREGPPAGRA